MSVAPAGVDRWRIAQAAEGKYWEVARQDEVELLRIMHEKAAAIRWCRERVPSCFEVSGAWIELGIGPLGIGCIHLVDARGRTLIGVDPLCPQAPASDKLSPILQSLLSSCRTQEYQHLVGRGEHIALPDACAALVVCYNVLDHCDDPAQVVREATRLLQQGGHFILGCDVYSHAGRVKYRARQFLASVAGTQLNSIGDLAHPHQFLAHDVEGMVRRAGLETAAINCRPGQLFKRLWSHAHRMIVVARKPQ
jgi:SAM-dependent methyltransferase